LANAFFGTKKRRLVGIGQNGHNHAVEQPDSPLDDVKVAIGEGVKTARVQRNQRFNLKVVSF
jgi:ketol-acid reductoisomerase